jgi:hypothetical protein
MPEYLLIGMALVALALCDPYHTKALREYAGTRSLWAATAAVVVTVLIWPLAVVDALLKWLRGDA